MQKDRPQPHPLCSSLSLHPCLSPFLLFSHFSSTFTRLPLPPPPRMAQLHSGLAFSLTFLSTQALSISSCDFAIEKQITLIVVILHIYAYTRKASHLRMQRKKQNLVSLNRQTRTTAKITDLVFFHTVSMQTWRSAAPVSETRSSTLFRSFQLELESSFSSQRNARCILL